MLAGPVFCACALTAMSKNLCDARWTVKAEFDDLYPLLFVMAFRVVWGWGGGISPFSLCVSLSNYVFFIAVFVTQHGEQTSRNLPNLHTIQGPCNYEIVHHSWGPWKLKLASSGDHLRGT